MSDDRLCEVPGCGNLGRRRAKSQGGGRDPLCNSHYRERRPAAKDTHRRHLRRIHAQRVARSLLRGVKVHSRSNHHKGVRLLLGAKRGDGLTASLVCGEDCPHSWVGHERKRGRDVPYRLCIPEHYVLEPMAANNARSRPARGPRRDIAASQELDDEWLPVPGALSQSVRPAE